MSENNNPNERKGNVETLIWLVLMIVFSILLIFVPIILIHKLLVYYISAVGFIGWIEAIVIYVLAFVPILNLIVSKMKK